MEQIQRTLAAGMDDAVTKPFAIKDLWPKMTGLIPRLAAAEEEMVGQE
jgi:DNA-binding response OmpR family regulator